FLIMTGDRELELYGRYEENAYFVRMLKLIGHKGHEFYELQGFDHGSMVEPAHFITIKYLKNMMKK
ncbi:MAG: alpha/beta hydrolase, partial [Bacteroidota bacterium]|nr:alpha/beta hydrolase [Bacteroidota bacterium]